MPSKLAKPECTVTETGRKIYRGSLSEGQLELTEHQKKQVLAELKTRPIMPSEIVSMIEGLSPYDPFCSESVRRYIGELETAGAVKQVKDAKNKLLGWQLKSDDE